MARSFEVTITETLERKVIVEADSPEQAEEIVSDRWYESDYILDADDFISVCFEAPEKIKREGISDIEDDMEI